MPSKRSHGEGTLRHRSDGRWELRMMDGYQKDGSPRFKTFYGKTQKEVKLKLKEYQDALISGVRLDTILYFEDQRWLAYRSRCCYVRKSHLPLRLTR